MYYRFGTQDDFDESLVKIIITSKEDSKRIDFLRKLTFIHLPLLLSTLKSGYGFNEITAIELKKIVDTLTKEILSIYRVTPSKILKTINP